MNVCFSCVVVFVNKPLKLHSLFAYSYHMSVQSQNVCFGNHKYPRIKHNNFDVLS
jgi:hypothetical protein